MGVCEEILITKVIQSTLSRCCRGGGGEWSGVERRGVEGEG